MVESIWMIGGNRKVSKLFTKEQIDGFNEEIASIGKYKLVSPITENPTDAEIICKRILYFFDDRNWTGHSFLGQIEEFVTEVLRADACITESAIIDQIKRNVGISERKQFKVEKIALLLSDIYDELGEHEYNTLYDAGSIRKCVESMESFIDEMQLVGQSSRGEEEKLLKSGYKNEKK